MRLALSIAAFTACLAVLAAPALAQQDPFEPVIDPNAPETTTGIGTTTGTGTTIGTGTTTGTGATTGTGSEALANTGSDVGPYLVIAYGLLVAGGGALYLAKLHAPRPTEH